VLNQVLVRFGESDDVTNDVIRRVQEGGVAWLGGTTWHGVRAMRVSVSNWMTTDGDIERSADAILGAFREVRGATTRRQPFLREFREAETEHAAGRTATYEDVETLLSDLKKS
jgi:hypothetical protein